ncbi:MAG TPA: hypothetical protein VHM70_16910, partial [Polyangiaceae bacterium]|nr:hypothetical protein [Polyangiaceae bacterium]
MKERCSTQVRRIWAALTLLLAVGCQDGQHALPADLNGSGPTPGSSLDVCARPNAGCACDRDGEVSECGSIKQRVGQYVICSEGERTCSSGVWSECVPLREKKKLASFAAPMQGGLSFQALGSATTCNNLCDPECKHLSDTPAGLMVPDDLYVGPDGLTLPAGGGGGSCTDLSVAPNSQTVTITAIAANGTVTASPASVDFDATCAGGVPVQPNWTINRYDRAVIDGSGTVTVYSGIAGTIQVTAQSSGDTEHAKVEVQVKIDDRGSSTTTATAFDGAGSGTDSARTLYPYRNTVFPLDLQAPLVQWQRGDTSAGANTATDVQVQLRFPKGCTPPTAATPTTNCTFYYSKIYNSTEPTCSTSSTMGPCLDNTQPAWQIPQEIWSAFDRTAAGDTTGAEIVIQRRYGSAVKPELTIPIKFATDSLKGTVYYTQYKRYLTSSSCPSSGTNARISSTYVPGNICPVGNCIQSTSAGAATTRSIDLSSTSATNNDPFGGTAGCPVCHAISPNGGRHVSVQSYNQTGFGGTGKGINDISSLMGDATFTGVGNPPTYSGLTTASDVNGEQSFGFSFNPIFPDGSRVLQGSNYWGSTEDIPSGGNNTQNANDLGIAGFLKPYFPVSTDLPGAGVQFATTPALALIPTTCPSGVMTATGSATLVVDGETMSTGNSLLMKDAPTAACNGVYTVTTVGNSTTKWKITRRSDLDASSEVKQGLEVRISDGNYNRGKIYYISSSTSSFTINSSSITFTKRANGPLVFGSSSLTADYATTAALTPTPVVLNSGANTLTGASFATLTVDGHNMVAGEKLLVKDQATASQNGVYTVTSIGAGGTGTALSASYATTAALPAHSWSSGVMTGTTTGTLSVDGVLLATNDAVLIKNEGSALQNGLYTLTTQGTGSGTPLTAQYATTAALPAHSQNVNVLSGYGVLSFDGSTPAVNDSVLIKNETTTSQHGVYTVQAVGVGASTVMPSVAYASTVNYGASFTSTGVLQGSANGAIAVDGVTLSLGDAVLLKNQTDQKQNGIYTLTTVGGGGGTAMPSVKYGSTVDVGGTFTSTGVLKATTAGPLAVDGFTLGTGDAVLLKNQSDPKQNGIYTLTTPATGGSVSMPSVKYASNATNYPGSFTSTGVLQATSFGVLTVDGTNVGSGDAVLLKDQTDPKQNGIYTLTTVGTPAGTAMPNVKYASTGNYAGSFTSTGVFQSSNWGPLTVDGATPVSTDAVLLKDQTTTTQNGIYTLTTAGNGGSQVQPTVKYASASTNYPGTTSAGTLTNSSWGQLVVDGSTVASGEAVLLKDQTTTTQNGI